MVVLEPKSNGCDRRFLLQVAQLEEPGAELCTQYYPRNLVHGEAVQDAKRCPAAAVHP